MLRVSYMRNLTAELGTMRTQLVPFPLNMPLRPSDCAMLRSPFHNPRYLSAPPPCPTCLSRTKVVRMHQGG